MNRHTQFALVVSIINLLSSFHPAALAREGEDLEGMGGGLKGVGGMGGGFKGVGGMGGGLKGVGGMGGGYKGVGGMGGGYRDVGDMGGGFNNSMLSRRYQNLDSARYQNMNGARYRNMGSEQANYGVAPGTNSLAIGLLRNRHEQEVLQPSFHQNASAPLQPGTALHRLRELQASEATLVRQGETRSGESMTPDSMGGFRMYAH